MYDHVVSQVWVLEEFPKLLSELDGKTPILAVSTANAPKRSKAEMDDLKEAKCVTKFVEVPAPGPLLPQEEYTFTVTEELYTGEFCIKRLVKMSIPNNGWQSNLLYFTSLYFLT